MDIGLTSAWNKMFVEQGARSFEIWTGQEMPKQEIYTILEKYLKDDHEILDHNL